MGRAVLAEIDKAHDLSVAFIVDHEDHKNFEGSGQADIMGDAPAPDWSGADVIIDFTSPGSTADHAAAAAKAGTPLVVGTTGLTPHDHASLASAGKSIAVVQAGNFSLGVNVLTALVEQAAAILGDDWDIEISETHHRYKADSPSGTALMLGDAAAKGRGVNLDDVSVRGRDGLAPERRAGDIGFASLRAGGVVGDHSVMIASPLERLVLTHNADDRALFAAGAIRAARFAATADAGRYSMREVLGL